MGQPSDSQRDSTGCRWAHLVDAMFSLPPPSSTWGELADKETLIPQFKGSMEPYALTILLAHNAAMLRCNVTILWYRSGTPGDVGRGGARLPARRNRQLFGHPDEVRQRARLHFLHGSAPVQLDGGFAGAERAGDLLIGQAANHQRHDFALPWAQS